MMENSLKLYLSIASILVSTGYLIYRKYTKKNVIIKSVWVIGASSGIGKGTYYYSNFE